MKKGTAQNVAVVLLIVTSIGAVGSFTVISNSLQDSAKEDTRTNEESSIGTVSLDEIQIDSFYSEGNIYNIVVKNTGDKSAEIKFRQGGKIFNQSQIEPEQTKKKELGCLRNEKNTITLEMEGKTRKEVFDIQEGYCIEIDETEIVYENLKSYKIWNGHVKLNDANQTAYSNKDIDLSFDQDEETISTNTTGEFSVKRSWDVPYIDPNNVWKKKITYQDSAKTVDFHLGRGKFQPPNRVRLDYEDGVSKVHQTQEVLKGVESDNIDLTYDVVPSDITDQRMEFNISMKIKAKQGLEDDWNNNPDAKLLYQIPIPEGNSWGGPYADITSISCDSSPDVHCETGEPTVSIDSSAAGTSFDTTNLPTDGSGDKYIPIDHQLESQNQDFVGSLNPTHYFHHGGSTHNNPDFSHKWYFRDNTKRMIYIPENSGMKLYDNISVKRLENDIQSQFSDSSLSADTTYLARQQIVTSALGWWNPPKVVQNNVKYSLNDPVEFNSDQGKSSSIKTLLYEWENVQQGQTYELNFTVRLKRHSNDRAFMLPVNQGTFGMFPDNGGEALNTGERYGVYTKGMLRYPPYRQTGRFSFRNTVPGTDTSTRSTVYKTTVPKENNKWEANTYVLNTGDHRIENIYLLNSKGQWETFETTNDGDNRLDAGESFTGGFDVDPNSGKKVKATLQYQTISSQSEPDYSDWPYVFDLNVFGETDYGFDLSDNVNCDTRHCLSYKLGHSEESRPIDDQRGGSEASKSLFDENLDRIEFYIKNNEDNSDTGYQDLKLFKFWLWLMEHYTGNLDDQLSNPDTLTIETVQNGGKKKGFLERDLN